MTDLEQVLAMFVRAGVVFERNDNPETTVLSCEAHNGPANNGYIGFIASMAFDHDGNLKSVGAWE
jgi:hypothetical protein